MRAVSHRAKQLEALLRAFEALRELGSITISQPSCSVVGHTKEILQRVRALIEQLDTRIHRGNPLILGNLRAHCNLRYLHAEFDMLVPEWPTDVSPANLLPRSLEQLDLQYLEA